MIRIVAWVVAFVSPIAAAELPAQIPVESLFSNPVMFSPVLSADGSTFAYVQAEGDLQVIFSRPVTGGTPTPLAKFDNPEMRLRWLRWANNDRLLVSGHARDPESIHVRGRVTRLFGIDRDRSNFAWLGKDWPAFGQHALQAQFQDQIIHLTPNDPQHVLIEYQAPYESWPQVMSLNVDSGEIRRVEGAHSEVETWHADGNGKVRAGEGHLDNRYLLWARGTTESKFEKVVEFREFDEEGPEFAGFHSDPGKVYVKAQHDGRAAIFEFELKSRTVGALAFAHPLVDVGGIERDAGPEERPVGVRYTVDRPEIHFFNEDAERAHHELRSTLEGEFGFPVFHRTVSRSADGQRQILEVSSEVQPPTYYLHDRKLRWLGRILEQRPDIAVKDLAPTRRVTYHARDGLRIPAYLTLPLGRESRMLPAIALVHGGPWSRDSIEWDPEVQLLANRGYAVLQMNFRGSSGFGKAHLEAGYRQWGAKVQDDITDGVKWLIAEGIADPGRIGIMGASYGGYATLVGLVKTPELYRAGAAYAPVTDIELMISDDKWYDWGYEWHQTMVGGERGDRSRLRESSPLRRVAEIEAPVLIGHGADDQRVHVRQSRRMADALRGAGKTFEYLEFPNEIHGFVLEANRIRWYTRLIDFFDENLAPRAAKDD